MTAMVFRRRRLPHQDVVGHPIFITGCLDGSLSANGFSRIEKYREQLDTRPRPDELTLQQWEERKQKLLFAFVDYIEQNPVKAVLVSSAADYLFSSAQIRKQLGLAAGQAIPEVALASSLPWQGKSLATRTKLPFGHNPWKHALSLNFSL